MHLCNVDDSTVEELLGLKPIFKWCVTSNLSVLNASD